MATPLVADYVLDLPLVPSDWAWPLSAAVTVTALADVASAAVSNGQPDLFLGLRPAALVQFDVSAAAGRGGAAAAAAGGGAAGAVAAAVLAAAAMWPRAGRAAAGPGMHVLHVDMHVATWLS